MSVRGAMILAAFAGLAIGLLVGPIGRYDHHLWKAALAVVTLGLALALPWLRTRATRRGRAAWWGTAALATVLATGAHWNFDPRFAAGLSDHTDPTYYYLNSKYFDELQYDGFYEALLLADREGDRRVVDKLRRVRSLRTYRLEDAKLALARAPQVKARFTPERWNRFKHDAAWFLQRKSRESLRKHFFIDHGYNPPPPWTLAGGTLSRTIPVEYVKVAALADVLLVGALIGVVAWGFGPEVAILALLWFLVSFSTRWPVLGHVILRYDWVAALGIGVTLLHRGRHALGGMALAWAGLVRLFPAVFWGCALLGYLADAVRQRRVTRPLVAFTVGSALFGAVVGAATLADVGTVGWANAIENLRMHDADPEAFSSQKVGLGDAVFFRLETTREAMAGSSCGFLERVVAGVDCVDHGDAAQGVVKGNGIAGKGVLVHAIRPWLRGLGLGTIAFLALYAWRTRRPPADLVHAGTLLVFIMTTPSFYYYSLRIVLVLFHLAHIERRPHQIGLTLVLATEVVTNLLVPAPVERYFATGSMSLLLLVYVLGWFAAALWEMRQPIPKDP